LPSRSERPGRGTAVDVSQPRAEDGGWRFRIEIAEVVLTFLGTPADHLVVQACHPGRGLEVTFRRETSAPHGPSRQRPSTAR
jgi:hypothetical protein